MGRSVPPRIRSIRSNLVLAFAMVIVFGILVLGTFTLYVFKNTVLQNAENTTMQLVGQLNRVIDAYIGYMDDIALVAMNNQDVMAQVEARSIEPAMASRISAFLKGIRTVRTDIDSIFLMPREGVLLSSDPERPLNPNLGDARQNWYEVYRLPAQRRIVSPARVENLTDDRYSWVISLVREFSPAGKRHPGFVQVDLNYGIIEELCSKVQLGASGYVFIINHMGEIVYHPWQQLIYAKLKNERIEDILRLKNGEIKATIDGREALFTAQTSDQTGWTVVGVSWMDELYFDSRNVEYWYYMIAIACFLLAVLLSSFVSSRISRPIEELRRSMQLVETGNFDIDITVNAKNEVYQLARDCDIAIKKIRDLIAQNKVEQEIKRKQSLLVLQAQINPHFLYNTLDSIIWMIELGDSDHAIEMTAALARFFRMGISKGSEIISIHNEVEHIHCYLIIQKMRYQSKLSFEIDVDPELYPCRVLKMLLQPLVENALYHGIKPRETPGRILVTGRREEREGRTVVVFRVIDDGVGMDADRLAAINHPAPDAEAGIGQEGHIGVRNVHERLRLYFGEPYGLSFASQPGAGTTATLVLPVMEGESGEA
jgi:two-component system sensor histidine kinase YesM